MSVAIPAHLLSGDDERSYVRGLLAVLRAARLNAYYPDPRRTSAHMRVLAPEVHQGLYEGVEVDRRSGLPTYKAWARVQSDVEVAITTKHKLGDRATLQAKARSGQAAHQRLLQRHDYYAAIAGTGLAPLGDMHARLRRVEDGWGWFHIVLDKLDAGGSYVRYAIDCAQPIERQTAAHLGKDEVARYSEHFRALIYQFTALDAEMTLVKLATLEGLRVERVMKGTIGPFYYPWSQQVPLWAQPVVSAGAYCATFGLDSAATDIAEEKHNDPLRLQRVSAGSEAERGRAEARRRWGYQCFTDRKYVVPRRLVGMQRQALDQHGFRSIVYGA